MKPCLTPPLLTVRSAPTRKKRTICILLVAILATMTAIFLFSSESVSESGERSFGVTVQIARILRPDFDDLSYDEQIEIVDGMHRIVRKGAHFTEYAVLGALVMLELIEIFLSPTSTAPSRVCSEAFKTAVLEPPLQPSSQTEIRTLSLSLLVIATPERVITALVFVTWNT